ncbi:MAG TPA: hypothetical protein VHP80_10755 [Candidatus Acidoferrum sp.]|nr:hypothetical protein [Candidatus Acidoferrum sp.]
MKAKVKIGRRQDLEIVRAWGAAVLRPYMSRGGVAIEVGLETSRDGHGVPCPYGENFVRHTDGSGARGSK